MTGLALYELSAQLQELMTLTDSDELPAEVIRDTLEAVGGSFEDKAVAVAKMVLSLNANAANIADAAKAMAERSARIEKRSEQLKAYLLFHCQATKTKRIEWPDIVIRTQANPEAVVVTNELQVPEQYWRQPEPPPKQLDKAKIKDALKAGAVIDGCYLDKGEHLRIST